MHRLATARRAAKRNQLLPGRRSRPIGAGSRGSSSGRLAIRIAVTAITCAPWIRFGSFALSNVSRLRVVRQPVLVRVLLAREPRHAGRVERQVVASRRMRRSAEPFDAQRPSATPAPARRSPCSRLAALQCRTPTTLPGAGVVDERHRRAWASRPCAARRTAASRAAPAPRR